MANDIKLQEGHPVDENLRPLKVGGKSTSLELADTDNGARVRGDLEVAGDVKVTGDIKGNVKDVELDLSTINSTDLTIDDAGSINLDATSSGASTGILLKNAGTLIGDVTVHHAATFLRLYENGGASGDDHLSIYCSANGSSTIQTTDTAGTVGHLNITVDGDITFNSASGKFIVKNGGTEFSVANSAYAGMILGYRCIGESGGHVSYTLTTGFAVPNSDMTVRFIAPPSGAVEIMVQVYCNATTSNKIVYFGLSDNSTYNTLGASYEQVVYMPDETDDNVVQNYWTITGLTAGDTYNYWFGAKISGTTGYLNWGGTSSNRYPDFIMKATALPTATADFAVYG